MSSSPGSNRGYQPPSRVNNVSLGGMESGGNFLMDSRSVEPRLPLLAQQESRSCLTGKNKIRWVSGGLVLMGAAAVCLYFWTFPMRVPPMNLQQGESIDELKFAALSPLTSSPSTPSSDGEQGKDRVMGKGGFKRSSYIPSSFFGLSSSAASDNVFDMIRDIAATATRAATALTSPKEAFVQWWKPDFFGFVPSFMGYVRPSKDQWTPLKGSECFPNARAKVSSKPHTTGDGDQDEDNESSSSWTITLDLGESPKKCWGTIGIGTLEGYQLCEFKGSPSKKPNTRSIDWTLRRDEDPDVVEDIEKSGFRFFSFFRTKTEVYGAIVTTGLLFAPAAEKSPDWASVKLNERFMEAMRGVKLPYASGVIPLSNAEAKDGDTLHILRMDGLDTLIAWGTGSVVAHVGVIFRESADSEGNEGGAKSSESVPYVYEVQAKSKHWPVNGIQKTELQQWLQQAEAAGMNVVYAPLKTSMRSYVSIEAIKGFFDKYQGVDYGYESFIFVWLDTLSRNFPCLPPHYNQQCLTFPFMELVLAAASHKAPGLVNKILIPGLKQRLVKDGDDKEDFTTLAGARRVARSKNTTLHETMIIPDSDEWLFDKAVGDEKEKRMQAPSLVCSSFVCRLLKEGGLFQTAYNITNSELNCAEFNNWDLDSLDIFDASNARQVLGTEGINIQELSTRKPHPHMAEKCAGLPPKYERGPDC